ncbi:MAG: hypothetical protein HFJ02_02015 [Bacilli bacterium]|jgi:hypothetical protein|nr:hypothetical protein [Bacilli bacterium]
MNQKKLKRKVNELKNFFKSIRFSTLYKIAGLILLIFTLYMVFTTLNKSKHIGETKDESLNATIIDKGENYLLILDNQKEEYLIEKKTTEDETIGSTIRFSINSIIDGDPKILKTTSIELINTVSNTKNADSEILEYIKKTNRMFSNASENESEIEIRYINILDFLIYNEKLENHTLNDLTSQARIEGLKVVLSLDSNVENFFPGFKEREGNGKYSGIKEKIITNYLNLTSKVCHYDSNTCTESINDFQTMKETFAISWNNIKNWTNDSERLKEWYQIYSGKNN